MVEHGLAEVLGPPAEGLVRLVVVHQRARTFRWWGLFELILKVLAFIILIPLWIILLFSALSLDGPDHADGGGSVGMGGNKKKDGKSYSKSTLFTYTHQILVQLIGRNGQPFETRTVTAYDMAHAEQLMATILAYAHQHRLMVSEHVDVNPGVQGPMENLQVWYGGRALMQGPSLRSAESLEPELLMQGFEIERKDQEIVLKRVFAPDSFFSAVFIVGIIVGLVIATGIAGTPLALILGAPFVLFALWVMRREFGELLFFLLCTFLRLKERFELVITPGNVRYQYRYAYKRQDGSTDGANLVAIGHSGGLGEAPFIDRKKPSLRIIGQQQSLRLPADLSKDVGPMLAEWLASTMLSLQTAHARHDFRSKCGYCGALYDLDTHDGCPQCGASVLDP